MSMKSPLRFVCVQKVIATTIHMYLKGSQCRYVSRLLFSFESKFTLVGLVLCRISIVEPIPLCLMAGVWGGSYPFEGFKNQHRSPQLLHADFRKESKGH